MGPPPTIDEAPLVRPSSGCFRMTSASPKRMREDRDSVSPSLGTVTPSRSRLEDLETLDIERFYKPKFLVAPKNIEVAEGGTTRIDCKVGGRPIPDVIFFRNWQEVQEDFQHRVVVKEDGVRSLIISPATTDDSGEYTVIAESQAGKAITTLSLTVIPHEGVERPKIIEKPQSITVNEGDMVRLEVFAVGKPTPEIVWLKDNMLLDPEKHTAFQIDGVDGHGLLTIDGAAKNYHEAWYTATAVNKAGRDITRCKVNVHQVGGPPATPTQKLYIPKSTKTADLHGSHDIRKLAGFSDGDMYKSTSSKKPVFKKRLDSCRTHSSGTANFECHVTPVGDPTMQISWFIDGKPIENAHRITSKIEFGFASLEIKPAYERDSGILTCKAVNAHGASACSCALVVRQDRDMIVEKTQLPEKQKLEKVEAKEKEREKISLAHDHPEEYKKMPACPPVIVMPAEPLRVKVGEAAKFMCRVVGSPEPKVQWYLNNLEIIPSKRFKVWYDGVFTFQINYARAYDSGEIRMVAENEHGQVESVIAIDVFEGEDFRHVLKKRIITQENVVAAYKQ